MKKNHLLLSTLLVVCIAVSLLYVNRQQSSIRNLEVQLDELSTNTMNLQAEKQGLTEANRLLQEKLAELREAPHYIQEQALPPALAMMEKATEPVDQGPLLVEDTYADVEEYSTVPPSEPPEISPQLRQMMAQFPEHVTEDFLNQPNTIQMYLDANPEIAEELKQPHSGLGSGIEQVMRDNPELAEKVRKNMSLANP